MSIDNYNHAYGSPVISLEHKNMLRLANFTVCGVSVCQQTVDNSFVREDSGNAQPSLPDHKVTLAAYVRPGDLDNDRFLLLVIIFLLVEASLFCFFPSLFVMLYRYY